MMHSTRTAHTSVAEELEAYWLTYIHLCVHKLDLFIVHPTEKKIIIFHFPKNNNIPNSTVYLLHIQIFYQN
jgi:hypothetical protein